MTQQAKAAKARRVQQWRYGASLVLLGAAHAQAFAPDPLPGVVLPYVQLLCLIFLARYVWNASSVKRAAVTGFLFGLGRSEEHTSELQSRENLVCRLLLEKKK